VRVFERQGIRLEYPGDWQLQTEPNEDLGWTITINSPDIAFFLLSYLPDVSEPSQVVDEAVGSVRADYPQVEAEPVTGTIAGLPAVGYDLDFFTVDQVAFANIRSICTGSGCLLILLQSTDQDRDWNEPILQEIMQSIRVED
jgi:hypothetical protein